MQTRRSTLLSLVALAGTFGTSWAADDSELPKAKVVKGKPPYLDFQDGLKVPCDKGAFLTLWEGPSYWLTFGFATATSRETANRRSVVHATGAMRYLLLTLAFAPDRLQLIDGHGWRQKEEKPSNYVMGDLELPGRPSRSLDDSFLGGGSADGSNFWGQPDVGGMGAITSDPSGGMSMGPSGFIPSMKLTDVNAFCAYVVLKKELSLADVRERAKILKI